MRMGRQLAAIENFQNANAEQRHAFLVLLLAQVEKRYDWASARFAAEESEQQVDNISRCYARTCVQRRHRTNKISSCQCTRASVDRALRVTSIFRLEDGDLETVHRHAGSIGRCDQRIACRSGAQKAALFQTRQRPANSLTNGRRTYSTSRINETRVYSLIRMSTHIASPKLNRDDRAALNHGVDARSDPKLHAAFGRPSLNWNRPSSRYTSGARWMIADSSSDFRNCRSDWRSRRRLPRQIGIFRAMRSRTWSRSTDPPNDDELGRLSFPAETIRLSAKAQ